jgi:hypothetical protein
VKTAGIILLLPKSRLTLALRLHAAIGIVLETAGVGAVRTDTGTANCGLSCIAKYEYMIESVEYWSD